MNHQRYRLTNQFRQRVVPVRISSPKEPIRFQWRKSPSSNDIVKPFCVFVSLLSYITHPYFFCFQPSLEVTDRAVTAEESRP